MYPYLQRYLPWQSGERLLEIGLGYGTVGQLLAERGLDYHGLDISPGPVAMMSHRLEMLGFAGRRARGSTVKVRRSRSRIPTNHSMWWSASAAYTTPETSRPRSTRSVACCAPAAQAMVMVYNSHSYRQR